ncbi:NAD-dependent epimerase/dehydratase family protein [Kitasatospora sp. NBC_01287]|uniref:NAD-dependent epimerase/dehydratase family protein n=1 Tax=Kitasatospora sp. NBC_01287 TaxID=2903573 RepID=UPI00225505CB|nr:NAD-dependent epimerase/dehydratase family protein [Kitasatospora sp. NBC_01287]MCX4749919.1 NAD-dependent epimerase/dehydratase family protein [Kitasatospora sp. NBC_01287]
MDVCVIGGSRYFGRRLIEELRDAGAAVTVVNRGSTPAPRGVVQLCADRDDEAALRAALSDRSFDVVVDQVCYSPLQAAAAVRVFTDRTRRYVLTSTVEVYAELGRPGGAPLPEQAVDPAAWPVDLELPWSDERFRADHYGEGKRQAEALLTRQAPFDVAAVRTAHVLGGADFTGRLAHYVERIERGLPVVVHPAPQPASFVHEPEIARFLAWAAVADFTGPVNAASHGALDALELCALVGSVVGREPVLVAGTGEPVSPFSFERCYAVDTGRAADLGFRFSSAADWLPQAVKDSAVPVL